MRPVLELARAHATDQVEVLLIQVSKGTGCLFTIIHDDILKLGPRPARPDAAAARPS